MDPGFAPAPECLPPPSRGPRAKERRRRIHDRAGGQFGQVYLERILGVGFLETQLKIQVHFLMLIGTGFIFAIGVGLYIYDFFRPRPRFTLIEDAPAASDHGNVRARRPAAA